MFIRSCVLLLFLTQGAMAQSPSPVAGTVIPWKPAAVSITIVSPSGTNEHRDIPWSVDTTVLQAMQAAGISFEARWTRELNDWRVVAIDDIRNQFAGGDQFNWDYCVSGRLASVNVSAYRLAPGAAVQWFYGVWPPDCLR